MKTIKETIKDRIIQLIKTCQTVKNKLLFHLTIVNGERWHYLAV